MWLNITQYACHQCLCPDSEPQLTPVSSGEPPRPAGRSDVGAYEVTAFALCSAYT